MLFGPASDTQIQAARVIAGATMAAFLAAPLFKGHAGRIRLAVAVLYSAGVLGFILYALM